MRCRPVDDPAPIDEVDLVVLGAPTHFWGLTGALSRTMEPQYERQMMPAGSPEEPARRAAATSGMRVALAALPHGRGRAAAAFDTCMTGPQSGGARAAIARRLERAGYRLLVPPQTFLVEAVAGPLRAGEVERARAWGAALGRAIDEQYTPNRRITMERHDTHVLPVLDGAAPDRAAPDRAAPDGAPGPAEAGAGSCRPIDVTRLITTTEVVVGAVLVARYLSQRPGSNKALVTMGPGGWVSMKGGTVAVRRGSRPFSPPTPIRPTPTPTGERAPLWARVLSAVPLQALMR